MENVGLNDKLFDEALKFVLARHDKIEMEEYKNITLKGGKHKFSPDYYDKKRRLLTTAKKSVKTEINRKSLWSIFNKIAVSILIVLSISFIGLLTVESVRQEVFNTVLTFFERYIRIEFRGENITDETMLDAINEVYLPSYIPDNFVQHELSKSEIDIFALYVNDENSIITYIQGLLYNAVYVSGEDYVIREIEINGMEGQLFTYPETDGDDVISTVVIWNDGKYYFNLTVENLSEHEVLKIADSVMRVFD